MSDRVLSTMTAKETIVKMQQLLNGPLMEQIQQLAQQGQTLSDPNIWDGQLAIKFRGEWPPTHQSLIKTQQALEELRAIEDDVDANTLAKVIDADPLLSIKYLAHAANRRRVSDSTDTETVLSSLVMTGVLPFFNHFGPQPTVEDRLMDLPLALEALQRLMHRATRAGNFALAFAVHRGSTDAAVIHQAAFLHDFAEMLMLCHAPTMELQIQGAMRADPTLRTAKAQRDVLNIELDDLRQELFKRWHLPQLLVRISDDKHLDHSNVLCAQLAVRLARHTMEDWDNAAIPDDIEAIAKLLNAAPRVALAFAKKVDLQCL